MATKVKGLVRTAKALNTIIYKDNVMIKLGLYKLKE